MGPKDTSAASLAGTLALAAVLCLSPGGAGAQSQAPLRGPVGKQPSPAAAAPKVYYDIYEPLQRPRLKRESCMKTEDSVGAYCVTKCNPSYELKSDVRPMRCVGTKPLPPGMLPGPIRSEKGIQPMPPIPDKPPPSKPGA